MPDIEQFDGEPQDLGAYRRSGLLSVQSTPLRAHSGDESTLRNCRVLVVEDEFMIAEEFCMELEDVGAVVLGPVGTVKETLQLIASVPVPDGAVLDAWRNGRSCRRHAG